MGRTLILSVAGVDFKLNPADTLNGLSYGTSSDPNNAAAGVQLRTQFNLGVSNASDVNVDELIDVLILVKYSLS
jgi:hypothetical protein